MNYAISQFERFKRSELKTLEWWISGLRLNPLFFLISRLNIAWKPHDFNLQINYSTGYLDILFYMFSKINFIQLQKNK